MELPNYHFPQVKSILRQTGQRLWGFVWRAGKLILPICVLIGVLNSISFEGKLIVSPQVGAQMGAQVDSQANHSSILSVIGRDLTPLFAPMGIRSDNWPATVGLMTGVLAKEVVIGTLNTLSSTKALFKGPIEAFAYLIFVLLYFPCISTIAVVARELGKKWACFSVAWSTMAAYGLAVLFYQLAMMKQHPLSSLLYVTATLGFMAMVVLGIHYFARLGKKVEATGESSIAWVDKGGRQPSCGNCRQCKPLVS